MKLTSRSDNVFVMHTCSFIVCGRIVCLSTSFLPTLRERSLTLSLHSIVARTLPLNLPYSTDQYVPAALTSTLRY